MRHKCYVLTSVRTGNNPTLLYRLPPQLAVAMFRCWLRRDPFAADYKARISIHPYRLLTLRHPSFHASRPQPLIGVIVPRGSSRRRQKKVRLRCVQVELTKLRSSNSLDTRVCPTGSLCKTSIPQHTNMPHSPRRDVSTATPCPAWTSPHP